MKEDTNNLIAAWLLFFFVSVPAGKAFFKFIDSLKRGQPIGTIVWNGAVALVLIAGGIFLFRRFVLVVQDLRYYEAEERQRESERP